MTAVAHDSPPTSPVTDGHGERVWRCPTSFRYWQARQEPRWRRLERVAGLVGHDLFPTDEQARMVCDDLYGGDPVAERFVSEVMFGETGHQRGRELLVQALEHGIDSVPEAPESMQALFDDFTTVPEWVDREQVELGASIWRRWGTMLFSVAGAITLEVYTEAGVATPLSLAGGYAGDNALRRFLETAKFWIDVSEPGALFTPGSAGRTTAMQVRIMHVAVRKRVGEHEEWDYDRLGLPISQTWAMLTQVGGSVAPSLALSLLGYQTTPREMRALQHFNRYMGHLLGVQPQWCPATVRECLQLLAMATAARSYDSGEHGTELIESFPRAFAPREHQRGLARLRARYNHGIYSAYSALWMAPGTRRGYDMPSALPWALLFPLRWPVVTVSELARRLPGLKQVHDRVMCAHRRNWWEFQMEGRRAEFDASSALRR